MGNAVTESLRLATHLKAAGLATDDSLAQIEREVTEAIDDAVAFAESSPSPACRRRRGRMHFGRRETSRQVDKA